MRLGRVIVFATSLPILHAFYARLLGRDPVQATEDWVAFDLDGGGQLALHAIPPQYAQIIATPAIPREDTAIKYVFLVDDLEAAIERAQAAGGQLGKRHASGARAFCDGIDPEGNVFQLATS